jgi:hypothetical protein
MYYTYITYKSYYFKYSNNISIKLNRNYDNKKSFPDFFSAI